METRDDRQQNNRVDHRRCHGLPECPPLLEVLGQSFENGPERAACFAGPYHVVRDGAKHVTVLTKRARQIVSALNAFEQLLHHALKALVSLVAANEA